MPCPRGQHRLFCVCRATALRVNKLMRQRVILIASVGLNVALAAAVIASLRHPGSGSILDPDAAPSAATNAGPPRVVVRRQFFTWRELESDKYPEYIKNLREIDCPEQTI